MAEIFDIVDEEGRPTGKTVERETAHAEGIRHRTAHIWVIRRNEGGQVQILLQKRAVNKDSFPGQYDTSSAGHIHAGDEPRISAVRELSEELGICAKPEELQYAGRFSINYEMEFYGKPFRDNEVCFVYVYDRPVDLKDLVLQKEEVEDAQWFDLEATREALRRHDPKFCVPGPGLETLRKWLRRPLAGGHSCKI